MNLVVGIAAVGDAAVITQLDGSADRPADANVAAFALPALTWQETIGRLDDSDAGAKVVDLPTRATLNEVE